MFAFLFAEVERLYSALCSAAVAGLALMSEIHIRQTEVRNTLRSLDMRHISEDMCAAVVPVQTRLRQTYLSFF